MFTSGSGEISSNSRMQICRMSWNRRGDFSATSRHPFNEARKVAGECVAIAEPRLFQDIRHVCVNDEHFAGVRLRQLAIVVNGGARAESPDKSKISHASLSQAIIVQ